ncbi:MAG: antibiotic biosynthesis monooxygenase, partial [Alphaproteobacteria bacterium]|nr:antibiotic biosynthesis monooxygenase [Alphaproteobacteria bacterium]
MRTMALALGCLLMAAGSMVQPARAQQAASPPAGAQQPATPGIYAVTYFEVAAATSRKALGLLRQFAAASRKEDGNAELTLLHELGRPGRYAIVEAWRDKAAADAHGAAIKALAEKLQPMFVSPFEARQFVPLAVAPATAADLSGSAWVLTHVDVFPAGKDEVAALVKGLVEDSRKDGGGQRFDAVLWDGHPNHFQLIEAWSDHKSRGAHVVADHT